MSSDVPQPLQLLLQQQDVAGRNSSVVVKLLATSNALRAAVADACSGRLDYSSTDPRETSFYTDFNRSKQNEASFCAWLAKHGHLLKALHAVDTAFLSSGADKLAAALRAAAASPRGLHLQSYDSDWDDTSSVQVLQALPKHSLTHLRLCLIEPMPEDDGGGWSQMEVYSDDDEYEMEDFIYGMREEGMRFIRTKHDNPATVAALSAFTKLSSLSLHGYETLHNDSPVMCGLSSLTSLAKLSVDTVLPSYRLLKFLPAQLRELEVNGVDRMYVAHKPLALGHLTALTRLHISASNEWGTREVCVGDSDVLPPNLASLCVGRIEGSLQPLSGLTSLRKLTLAQMPLVSQLPGSGSAGGSSSSKARQTQTAKPAGSSKETATLEQLQACLPAGVAVTLASGRIGQQCHCCSPAAGGR